MALKPGFFSFVVDGGRCEKCHKGQLTAIDAIMADVHLTCDECHGKRFKEEVLEVKYKDKNTDILEMTVEESLTFFDQDDTQKTNQR